MAENSARRETVRLSECIGAREEDSGDGPDGLEQKTEEDTLPHNCDRASASGLNGECNHPTTAQVKDSDRRPRALN